MRDEDDDLLRAAEELGIDLSGVRQTDGAAADETEEHEGETVEDSQEESDSADVPGGPEMVAEDMASDTDEMINAAVPAGDAEGVQEEDES
jgi:DNA-directed RNA polymerase subunit beta